MKKLLLLVCTLLIGIPAFAQSLTPAERQKGVQYLEQTRDGVVAAVKGLSGAQMKFKPAPDRWSVAETLEHIALAENDAHNLFAQAMKSPAGPPDRDFAKVDAMSIDTRDSSGISVRLAALIFSGLWLLPCFLRNLPVRLSGSGKGTAVNNTHDATPLWDDLQRA